MGHCHSKKAISAVNDTASTSSVDTTPGPPPAPAEKSPWMSPFPAGINPSPAATPGRKLFKWPFPPPSPAKPIMEAILRRQGRKKINLDGSSTPEAANEDEGQKEKVKKEKHVRGMKLNKEFGYPKNFGAKYEIGKEVGKGHFGHTCLAMGKKAEIKGLSVAIKIISKAKMTSALAIEDVRREVKLLKAFSGQKHMLKFYDAFEDSNNVYIVTELCEGGELLDRILQRGGCYTEKDAKTVLVQILSAVAFCHTQGVVHRDLKPENFLFTTKDEDSLLKIIDFGLSEFVSPDQRLNDVVGSAYYVAPEVLHRSYNVEADMWSIGVIAYILLCGSRPFWARTESGVFRSVLRANPDFENTAWASISLQAKDFVKRLLNKDPRKRMTAVQALAHPWLRGQNQPLPLDILTYKLVRSYIQAPPLKRAALKALSKALTENELFYLREQFRLLEPNNGCVSLENFKAVLTRNTTDAMKQARVTEILAMMEPLSVKSMDFEEFCCAAISVYQLEVLESWDKIATVAFQYFEQEGNRVISVEELAKEMNLDPRAYALIKDWIRSSDGKLNFLGYTKFLHGVTIRGSNPRRE